LDVPVGVLEMRRVRGEYCILSVSIFILVTDYALKFSTHVSATLKQSDKPTFACKTQIPPHLLVHHLPPPYQLSLVSARALVAPSVVLHDSSYLRQCLQNVTWDTIQRILSWQRKCASSRRRKPFSSRTEGYVLPLPDDQASRFRMPSQTENA
jgi:hypothetical protein